MKAYQVGLLVQRDPLRLAIVLDNGEGCTAAEAILTSEQANGLGHALITAAAREHIEAENAADEKNSMHSSARGRSERFNKRAIGTTKNSAIGTDSPQ